MTYQNFDYFKELAAIPEVIERLANKSYQIAAHNICINRQPPKGILTIARGSSENAAFFMRDLFSGVLGGPEGRLAVPVMALEPGAMPQMDLTGWVCFAISQSGGGTDTTKNPDILDTARAVHECGATLFAMTNDTNSLLAQYVKSVHDRDYILDMAAGMEYAVPATKTYAATLMLAAKIYAACEKHCGIHTAFEQSLHALTDHLDVDADAIITEAYSDNTDMRPVLMVTGPAYRSFVKEASLKLMEVLSVMVMGMTAPDSIHGPHAILNGKVRLCHFLSSQIDDSDHAKLGETLFGFGNDYAAVQAQLEEWDVTDQRAQILVHGLRTVTQVNYHVLGRALAMDINPDTSLRLAKVTVTGAARRDLAA